jgi:hypothetical protein
MEDAISIEFKETLRRSVRRDRLHDGDLCPPPTYPVIELHPP